MLWKNAHDVDSDGSGDALVGLARRQYPRAVGLLKPRLTDECRVYEFDAAQALKDPALAGPLRVLREAVDRETGIDPFWHDQLVDDVLNPFTIFAHHTNELHATGDEPFYKRIKLHPVAGWAMQYHLRRVFHGHLGYRKAAPRERLHVADH